MANIAEKLKPHYEFRKKASTKNRLFFRKDYAYKNNKRRIHIHLTTFSGMGWKEIIFFRDHLRKHPEEIREYEEIKKLAVKRARGKEKIYKKYKLEFMKKVLRKIK